MTRTNQSGLKGLPGGAKLSRTIRVGCAGWAVSKELAERFPADGTHLAKYAERFPAVEINSSFYRSHRPATYARWADSVPDDFRFSIKVPRRQSRASPWRSRVCPTASAMGEFNSAVNPDHYSSSYRQACCSPPTWRQLFSLRLRDRFGGDIVVEPRHASWFVSEAETADDRVSRDSCGSRSASSHGLAARWLGRADLPPAPWIAENALLDILFPLIFRTLSRRLSQPPSSAEVCIFDNTAAGSAIANAFELLDRLHAPSEGKDIWLTRAARRFLTQTASLQI